MAERLQLPLMLAWAISIHKSQGMTIPFLDIKFAGMFEYGQAYVALSRAVDLDGLNLTDFNPDAIKAHDQVVRFYEQMQRNLPSVSSSILIETTLGVLAKEFAAKSQTESTEIVKASLENEWLDVKRVKHETLKASAEKSVDDDDMMLIMDFKPQAAQVASSISVGKEFTVNSSFATAMLPSSTPVVSRKAGDWECQNCSYLVFASKNSCPKCGSEEQTLSVLKPLNPNHQLSFAVPSHFGGRSTVTKGPIQSISIKEENHSKGPPIVGSSKLTEEQKRRIEENKRQAIERLAAAKLQREAEMSIFLSSHQKYFS
jgi:hypothetical protein